MKLSVMLMLGLLTISPTAVLAAPATGESTPSSTAVAPENALTTALAKDMYHQLQTGKLDRSRLSEKLNAALTDEIVKTVSAQLTAIGDPTWQYMNTVSSPDGPVAVYKVETKTVSFYYNFGVGADKTVFNLLLAPIQ